MTLLTVGSRDSKNPQGCGAFFDNTPRRPYETYVVTLGKRHVQTTNNGTRTTVSLAEASAGGFRGELRFTFYRNSPLIHVETRRLSDDELLLLPGEEPNVHLGGHWISLFPKPVNWTLNRPDGKPFVEEINGFGNVYHVGSPADVLRLFEAERGLMWTAHPRIKSSFGYPDQYKDTAFFRSDRFLGGAWKAMPADLSRPTLGWRALDLLDDMCNWGLKKHVPGEVDTFRMEPDFETYAHMNINHLRLAKLPGYEEGWQPVLDALRSGEFFTTTDEVLIP